MISTILLILALLSMLLNLWQWYAAKRFRFEKVSGFTPPLSILRPLKGCDAETERCLESWFTQKYPAEYELLFAVASDEDPVCDLARRLSARYPNTPAELIIARPVLGPNAKVSSLCHLARKARHEHIVIADQDVFIAPDFLPTLAAPMRDPAVGLVNCFYILANARGLAMRLEAVAVNADFWSQVLQGNTLKPMEFALGAVILTRRTALDSIGGFETLLEYLADDYQLGNRITKTGARLALCSLPVECRSQPQTARAVWKHQLRWGRTIRVCQPAPYFFSILSNGTLWPLIACAADRRLGLACLLGAMAVRTLTAAGNYRKLTGASGWTAGVLAPLKDLFQVVVWAASFIGNEITWRGQRYRVDRGGKLTPLA